VKILVDNQLVEYADVGSGQVILLLHGWGMSLNTFDKLSNHLSKKFRIIRFDFPGFGQSPKPTDDWLVSDYAKLTADLLDKLKIKQLFAVIGHSFGGRVIIKGISLNYLNPNKVILISSAGIKPKQKFKKSIYKTIAKVGKVATSIPLINKMQPTLKNRLYKSAGSTDYLQANQMRKIFVNITSEDLLPEVSKITQQSLLIWGSSDTITPTSDAKLILKSLQNGELIIIPNAGHLVYIDEPNRVITELDKFLL
jgi:pimeloyl-ACP methyl ester carboxylesterase